VCHDLIEGVIKCTPSEVIYVLLVMYSSSDTTNFLIGDAIVET